MCKKVICRLAVAYLHFSNCSVCMDLLEYSSDEEPEILSVNIFSENYSNQHGMSSVYVYIPWRPSHQNLRIIKSFTDRALQHLKASDPELHDRFQWDMYGFPSTSTTGRLSLRNIRGIRAHHITLLPNLTGQRHHLHQLVENIQHGIKQYRVAPELVRTTEVSQLNSTNRILLQGFKSGSMKSTISMNLGNKLTIKRSHRSQRLFLATELATPEGSALHRFFQDLRQMYWSQIQALDLDIPYEGSEADFVEKYFGEYHITFALGEMKNFQANLTDEEVQRMTEIVQEVDVADELSEVKVEFDKMIIDEVDHTRRNHPIEFNLGEST